MNENECFLTAISVHKLLFIDLFCLLLLLVRPDCGLCEICMNISMALCIQYTCTNHRKLYRYIYINIIYKYIYSISYFWLFFCIFISFHLFFDSKSILTKLRFSFVVCGFVFFFLYLQL